MAFFKGAVWGVVIGGAGVVAGSLVAPQPAGNAPPAPPLVAAPDVAPAAADAGATRPSSALLAPPPATAPAAPIQTPDGGVDTVAADTAPPVRPSPEASPAEPAPPEAVAAEQGTPGGDAPVLPNPQSRAPEVPTAETDIVVQTAPPAPIEVTRPEPLTPAPDRSAGTGTDTPRAASDETAVQVDAATDTPVTVLDPAPTPDAAPDGDVLTADPVPGAADMPSDLAAATGQRPSGRSMSPADLPTPGDADASPPDSATSGIDEGAADAATQARRPAVVSIIDTPSQGLPGAGSTVIVSPTGTPTVIPPEPEVAAPDDDSPALVRYGAFFDNPAGLPLLSVLLIDDGRTSSGVRAVSEVPFPVTVVLDPSGPGATERMNAYVDAGIEVAAMAAIPAGATATDIEVAMAGTFDALPRAVALIDAGGGALPIGTDVVARVIGDLSRAGRGLVVPDQGLNGALRAAAASDVPAATIYRDLDGEGQDARVIRRFIDQAAFRARQQTGVVLLARVRPETLSALILWGDANRAGQVALAPLSAMLLAQ